jgi:hypothetical protein
MTKRQLLVDQDYILDDKDYRLGSGLGGSLVVFWKSRNQYFGVDPDEGNYFSRLCRRMEDHGITIELGSTGLKDAAHDFCEAVIHRGFAKSSAFFSTSPQEQADSYAGNSNAYRADPHGKP